MIKKQSPILDFIQTISFKFEPDGKGKKRLDIYKGGKGFKNNLNKYVKDFVPECNRIADYLNQSNITYLRIQNEKVKFNPIDVEMAIFSYATKHDIF